MFDLETFSRFAPAAALAFALAALLRPEVERLLRHRSIRFDMLPAPGIEIGFSEWGPTIGLSLSFHGHGEDQFVLDMRLTATRSDETADHGFSWAAFRPARLDAGLGEATAPGAFAVTRLEPRQVNILFQDRKTQRIYADGMRALRRRFIEFMAFQRLKPEIMSEHDLGREVANFRASSRYDTDAADAARNAFYWGPGEYALVLEVQTGQALLTSRYRFALSGEEASVLRDNAGRMEDARLGLSSRKPAAINVALDKIA